MCVFSPEQRSPSNVIFYVSCDDLLIVYILQFVKHFIAITLTIDTTDSHNNCFRVNDNNMRDEDNNLVNTVSVDVANKIISVFPSIF